MSESESVLKKAYGKLVFACLFLYCISMATKNLYTAEIIEIIDVFNTTRAKASLSNTFYYVVYGVSQIVLSFFYHKMDVRKYIGITSVISALLVGSIFFAKSLTYCWIVFAVNGVVTAGLYSGIVLLFTRYLPSGLLPRVNKIFSSLGVGANVLSYGLGAFCVGFLKWNFGFAILGGIFLIACVIFITFTATSISSIKKYKGENVQLKETKTKSGADYLQITKKRDVVVLYVINVVLIFFSTALYFSLSGWFSDILYSVYNVPKTYSILVTLLMPIVVLFGPIFTVNYCEKRRNLYLNSVVFFLVPIAIPLFLYFFYDFSLVGAIIIILAYVIIVNGGRGIFSTLFAFHMKDTINSGTYSLITNAFASFSAGISPTIVGYVADIGGWGSSFLFLFILNAFMVVGSLVALLVFKNKIKKQNR